MRLILHGGPHDGERHDHVRDDCCRFEPRWSAPLKFGPPNLRVSWKTDHHGPLLLIHCSSNLLGVN